MSSGIGVAGSPISAPAAAASAAVWQRAIFGPVTTCGGGDARVGGVGRVGGMAAVPHGIPAVVTAGDRGAARAIRGESKPYLILGGRPLVVHVIELLQQVPEVSAVWVVGDPERLGEVFAAAGFLGGGTPLAKPLGIIPQREDLYQNAWQSFRRILPGAPPEGRDPTPDDAQQRVFYLSADLPFATAQEISAFLQRGLSLDCDYALGLCSEESMQDFYPTPQGEPGIRLAAFNLREGRFRQSNLHLAKVARIGNRHHIGEMYAQRYQLRLGAVLRLAWRIVRASGGGFATIRDYLLLHAAGFADRHGWGRFADGLRSRLPLPRVERRVGSLLQTEFRFVVTRAGGCAVDIDTEEHYRAAQARFESWRAAQAARAEALYGVLTTSGGDGCATEGGEVRGERADG